MSDIQMLNTTQALAVNPFYSGSYQPPIYVQPGTRITVAVESREQELAILAAYDYGLDALSQAAKEQLNYLIADLKVAMTGR